MSSLPPLVILGVESLTRPDAIRGMLSEGMVVTIAPDPLTARAWFPHALQQRAPNEQEDAIVRNGGLEIDRVARRASFAGRPIRLTKFEFQLLSLLADDFGRAWGFRELTTAVWGTTMYGDFTALKSAVKRLRRKLAEAMVDFEIESVRGVGYRLNVVT